MEKFFRKPKRLTSVLSAIFLSIGILYLIISKSISNTKYADPINYDENIYYLFLILGFIFSCTGVILIYHSVKSIKLHKELHESGFETVATISLIKANRNVNFGINKHPYVIHYTYGLDEKIYLNKSLFVWDVSSYNIGDEIKILVDKNDYRKSITLFD